jgi:hypothetical protein
MASIDTIVLLGVERAQIVWAIQGSWHRQSDAGVLPNGNILLFDNYGPYGSGGESRVIEFSPTTSKMVWTYAGDEH